MPFEPFSPRAGYRFVDVTERETDRADEREQWHRLSNRYTKDFKGGKQSIWCDTREAQRRGISDESHVFRVSKDGERVGSFTPYRVTTVRVVNQVRQFRATPAPMIREARTDEFWALLADTLKWFLNNPLIRTPTGAVWQLVRWSFPDPAEAHPAQHQWPMLRIAPLLDQFDPSVYEIAEIERPGDPDRPTGEYRRYLDFIRLRSGG